MKVYSLEESVQLHDTQGWLSMHELLEVFHKIIGKTRMMGLMNTLVRRIPELRRWGTKKSKTGRTTRVYLFSPATPLQLARYLVDLQGFGAELKDAIEVKHSALSREPWGPQKEVKPAPVQPPSLSEEPEEKRAIPRTETTFTGTLSFPKSVWAITADGARFVDGDETVSLSELKAITQAVELAAEFTDWLSARKGEEDES